MAGPEHPAGGGRRVLYISYDGILEPIGRSQVFLYLQRLASRHRIVLITFEKPSDLADEARVRETAEACAAAGLDWIPLTYHRAPSLPATAFDIACGFYAAATRLRRGDIEIVHARSYVPALIAWLLKRLYGTRFLFDMRGFWADQRRDCGAWRQGHLVFRSAKWLERRFFLEADAVVSLTRAGVDAISAFPYMRGRRQRFAVIPTCTDLELFRLEPGRRGAADGPFVVGFVGTLSVSYLVGEMLEAFKTVRERRADARLLILSKDDPRAIRRALAQHAIPEAAFELLSVAHGEVPAQLNRMSAAIFFLKPFPSLKGVAPTKLGELLACGVPVLANSGIGDYDRIVGQHGVGVTIPSFEPETLSRGAAEILRLAGEPGIAQRCSEAARAEFSLSDGLAAYDALYRRL